MKGVAIESGPSIPSDSHCATNHCVWFQERLHNNLVTRSSDGPYLPVYGNVNLDDLQEGDCVGLCLSQDGVLEFTVNGESQGVVAKNIYTRDSDVYAVVDHYGSCVATVITKAGELHVFTSCYAINAWLICLFSTSIQNCNWSYVCIHTHFLSTCTQTPIIWHAHSYRYQPSRIMSR